MNTVSLIGRLTRDPEVRYTSTTQIAVASFSIAIDRPVKEGGEKQTDFPNIVVFGKQAENCERYLAKGRKVAINGRIQTRSYTDEEGRKVYTTDVIAYYVEFLDNWAYKPEKCDGDFCPGDCDHCRKAEQGEQAEGFKQADDDIPF